MGPPLAAAAPLRAGGGLLALYDGRELVFRESPWRLLTLLRLFWRYLFSFWAFSTAPAATFEKFNGARLAWAGALGLQAAWAGAESPAAA